MFNVILNSDNAKKQEAFQLYITGYAHFFNIDTDGCNTTSFGALPVHQPLLNIALRSAINGLVQDLNDMYQAAITEENDPNVHYVDVSESPNDGFDTHRFCDIGITDKYNVTISGSGISTGQPHLTQLHRTAKLPQFRYTKRPVRS